MNDDDDVPVRVSATLALEAYRARLVAFLNFVHDAAAGRAQLPTSPDALQTSLDGAVMYLLAGEEAFGAARARIAAHAEHHRALVEAEQQTAAARQELATAVDGVRGVQRQLAAALLRAHAALAALPIDRAAAVRRDGELRDASRAAAEAAAAAADVAAAGPVAAAAAAAAASAPAAPWMASASAAAAPQNPTALGVDAQPPGPADAALPANVRKRSRSDSRDGGEDGAQGSAAPAGLGAAAGVGPPTRLPHVGAADSAPAGTAAATPGATATAAAAPARAGTGADVVGMIAKLDRAARARLLAFLPPGWRPGQPLPDGLPDLATLLMRAQAS